MKILELKSILFCLMAVVMVTVFFTSCEKDILPFPADDTSPFKIEDFEDEPLLYANFDGNMTAEEVDVQAKKMLKDYICTLDTEELENRGVSTEWFSVLKFRTGSQTDNNTTNGTIRVTSTFRSSYGTTRHNTSILRPGRKLGEWDVYIRRNYIRHKTVEWVEAEKVSLAFIGSDNWFLTDKQLHLYSLNQTVAADGYSRISEKPNEWYYNDSPSTTHIILAPPHFNTGRLNF